MKQISFVSMIALYLFFFQAPWNKLRGQAGCELQPPALQVDFGNSTRSVELNLSSIGNYQQVYHDCPQDGNYAIVSSTSDCFSGHWITVNQDHTPNDTEGKMMLVNAAYRTGVFFVTTLKGLSPNTNYELSAWVLNVCWAAFTCIPARPNLLFIVENSAGKELAKFVTGELPLAGTTSWIQYSALLKTPADGGALLLKIETKADGGCGNDFAIDDITLRKCMVNKSIINERPKQANKPADKQPIAPTKPVVKQSAPFRKRVQKEAPALLKVKIKDTLTTHRPVPKSRPAFTPAPLPVLSRANPVIKQIETMAAELVIDLYDNGEIDGDTVSIYHNNQLIVSRAALSAKPITFRLSVDAMHPHHELVMVANNLGSIPPNTSLMIVTARDKRYEVFISSSEQKNARVVINLKSP